MPGLPQIDSTLEIVAISATGALIVAGILAFIAGTIRALTDNSSTPKQDVRDW
jgi:hypothetical protein